NAHVKNEGRRPEPPPDANARAQHRTGLRRLRDDDEVPGVRRGISTGEAREVVELPEEAVTLDPRNRLRGRTPDEARYARTHLAGSRAPDGPAFDRGDLDERSASDGAARRR